MAVVRANGADFELEQVGQGRDVLLLHSLLTDPSSFAPIVPALSRERRVTLLALPGFGRSTPAGPAIDDYADRVVDLLAAVAPGQPDVIANGFGGFVAIALAARHGNRIGRLVLSDTAASFPESVRATFRAMAEAVTKQGMAAILDTAVRRIFPPAYLAAHPEAVEERKRILLRADAEHFATACRALAAVDLRPQLERIENPTLVVVGALDQATPPELAREVAAGIRGAALRELADCGHCPPLEKPGEFLATIRGFLDLHASSASEQEEPGEEDA